MKNIINQLIKEEISVLQLKFFLFLLSNYEFMKSKNFEIKVTELSELLFTNEKSLIKELKLICLKSDIINCLIEEKIIKITINNVSFNIINDTRSKLKTKSVERKKEINEVFLYWQDKCNKKRAILDTKREKIINNAIDNYGIDSVYKAIEGCSKTLWNMGYDKFGNKTQTLYNELSLIFRNIEYVERFISNSELLTIEEQVDNLNNKSKGLVSTRNSIDDSRNNWKEERLGIFDN